MLPTTSAAVRSILAADPSLTPSDRAGILAGLRNHGRPAEPTAPTPATNEPRLIRRREAAARLGRSLRALDLLARQGILPRVILPGRVRGGGFRESDLVRLIEGRAVPAPVMPVGGEA